MTIDRRTLLMPLAAISALSLTALPVLAQRAPLELTPDCGDGERTIPSTEGPFFRPNTPRRRDLAADVPDGEAFLLGGIVLDETCRPVPEALVELWHADDRGRYDNDGYRLRGHQFADDGGMWWFSTIVPGAYPSRTRHYHFKVQRPGDRILTTQLYFPDEPRNRRDRLFDPRLLMRTGSAEGRPFGRFDFVV